MTIDNNVSDIIESQKTYKRFGIGQRLEHYILMLSSTVLLLTGLPQKYRDFSWSQILLSTPERLEFIRLIHHISAIVLTLLAVYHFGKAIIKLFQKKLSGDMLITWQDVLDAFGMMKFLLFIKKEKPKFGKFNFEQKVTYWVVAIGFVLMILSGFIIWFPVWFTQWFPGGAVPAAKLMHSSEAIAAAFFILIWHIYHVHIERLNLSIFTGKLTEKEMKEYHKKEYDRIEHSVKPKSGAK
jgi:formate dehydrogenase subunit gamma